MTTVVDARGLEQANARLFDRSRRFVGWGSGSLFDYYHGLHPFRLDYIVDNDASRWGQRRGGVPIVGPEHLAKDDPSATFVLIYSSSWQEIQRQIAAIGPFESLPAGMACPNVAVRAQFDHAESIASIPRVARRPGRDDAVVVQGPVVPVVTARVLRVMTALNPAARVVLSTWSDTDPALLEEAAACADDLVVSGRPECGGVQNRNYQIVSTCAGIERAIANGATTILKTRTDLVVLASLVFEKGRSWLDRHGHRAARTMGRRERLIVPASFTRKFLLYHASDMVMLGTADDLREYWSAPLDLRSGHLLSSLRLDQPLASVNLNGNPAESYLGVQFCRRLGRPIEGTLADSWAFYRDLFAVVDNDWFDLLWYKSPSMPDLAVRHGVRELVSQAFWQRLHSGDPTVASDAGLDPAVVTLRALACAA